MQWLVMSAIVELESSEREGLPQSEVADALGVSERVVSYTMIALVNCGWVERGPGEVWQAWGVELTPHGRQVFGHCQRRLEEARRGFPLAGAA